MPPTIAECRVLSVRQAFPPMLSNFQAPCQIVLCKHEAGLFAISVGKGGDPCKICYETGEDITEVKEKSIAL